MWRNQEEGAFEWGWPGWGGEGEADAAEVCTGASRTGGEWYLKGFGTSPGGTKLVVGKYTVGAVEPQVYG